MSKLITAKTGEIQDNVRKERERLTGEIRVMIEKNLLKDENQKLNELNSSLMNHSRFVENVFDETNPENVLKVEIHEKLDEVLSWAEEMSDRVGQFESWLDERSPCDRLAVGRLGAEMKSLSKKVDGFVMQNVKIANFLPPRIEGLEGRLRKLEDKLFEDRKVKKTVC